MNYVTHWCPTCGGVSHPATGCVYSPSFVVCWRCTLEFGHWLERWTNRGPVPARRGKSAKPAFFAHVNRIHPPVFVDSNSGLTDKAAELC